MRNSTSEGVEIHLIKTTVTLRRVNITVRFPCSISFALKYETNVVEHQNVHELRNGQCLVGESIDMQLEVPYQNGRYDEKKMSLLIFMISVNGKIPAGSVSINPTERVMGDKKVGLEKCPDKNAEVIFSLNFEKVKMERISSTFGRKGVPQVTVSPSEKIQQSRERLSANRIMSTGSSGLFKSQVEGVYKSSVREDGQKIDPVRMHSSRVVEVPPLRQRFSLTTSEYQVIARSPQSPANLSANLPRQKSIFNKLQHNTSDFNGSHSSNRIMQNSEQQTQHKIRLTTLQRENEGFIQQISKMKKSVRDVDSEEHYSHNHQQMDDELNLVIGKQKMDSSKLSPEISDREMNQRERLSESSSQKLEEWNKRKSRVLIPLDNSRGEYDIRLIEKDRLISQLQNDKFKLELTLQEERNSKVQGQKRMEVKESAYRQELKKMKDRVSQMQVEKQKAIFDYNNMQSQVETSERKSQLTLRQKERNLIDERNKLTKKLEQANLDCASLRQAQEETKTLIGEYQAEKQKTIGEFKSKQLRINELVQANKTLQSDLKSLEATNAMLKEEVEHVSSQFSDDKGSFRKKYMEAHNELTLQKDKLQKLKAANLTLETRNRELAQRLQRQTKEKNAISARLEQAKRNQQKLLQQQESKQRSGESLSSMNLVQNVAQNSKLTELRTKLQGEKKKYEQMQKKYEEKDQYFQQSKAEMQTEMEELKWQIKAQADKLQAQSAKNREINEQMIDMSRRVIDMETKAAEDEELFNEKESRIAELEQNVYQLQIDLESAKQNLKTIIVLQDALSRKQEDVSLLQQGFDKSNASSLAQMQVLQRTIDEQQSEIRNKNKEIMGLHDEMDLAKEEKYKLTQNVNARVNELAIARELNKTLTQDYTVISDKFARINEEEKSRTQRLQFLEEGLSQKAGQLSAALRECELVTSQFEEFKFALKQTLEQLIEEVNREEREQGVSVIPFKPDSQLQFLLTDCLKKHQQRVGRVQERLLEEAGTVSVLEEELFKQQAWIEKLGEEHDENLRRHDERLKGVVQGKNREMGELRGQLQDEAQKLSEYTVEVDFLNSEINKLEYTVEELNRQILIHKQNENELRQLSSEMEIEIFNLKEKDYKERVMSQAEQDELKRAFEAEIERKKDALKGLGEELKLKDRTISERSEEIKRTLSSEEQGKAERLRLAQQLKESTAKCSQEANGRGLAERQLKEKQKTLRDLQEQFLSCKRAIEQSKTREIVQSEQLKKLKGDLYLQEDRYKLLKEDQQLRYANVSQSEKREREKTDRLELIKAKLEQQNLELREKYMKLDSEMEFHKFHKVESGKKIEELEKAKEEAVAELYRQKEAVFKLDKEIGNYDTKIFKLQTELDNAERDKANLADNLQIYKEKVAELQQAKRKMESDFSNELNEMHYKIQDYDKLRDAFSNSEQQYEKTLNDIRNQLIQARQQLNLRGNLIDELQKMLEDRPCDINVQKAKWQAELQNERRELQIKMSKIEQNFLVLQQQLQFQKQQSIKEIEGANGVIQELNEVVRDKEESIEYKEEVINEQVIQLQQLNLQLNECISKWEREKEAYLPTATKMNELNEEIARMNKFIIELDGRNKQLLEINKRKMQQKIETKGSITDMLKEILLLVQKNKNKLLGRCLNDKEKEQVIAEFKTLQDKLDMTLKSTQIVSIAAPKKE